MQSTGQFSLKSFQVRKTKKNKFVVELMESLKESYEKQAKVKAAKRSKTMEPPKSRTSNQREKSPSPAKSDHLKKEEE